MRLKIAHTRRPLAFLMTLVMLLNLSITAAAVGETYNLYSFVAEKCYSGRTTEVKILTSGALVDAGSITISYPGNDLLSVSEGKLIAGNFASGINGRDWVPVKYAIDNGAESSFGVGNAAVLNKFGDFQAEVTYQLETGIGSEILNLPSILAQEAAGQMSVLDRLTNFDEPYMDYMEQMERGQMELLCEILSPSYSLADMVKLNSDPAKNTAIKNSFCEVIGEMIENCYMRDGTLTFYELLWWYVDEGLTHYYQNSERYLREVALFSEYLDALLVPETRDGVDLTAADKEAAIQKMAGYAADLGYTEEGGSLDFVDMKNKTNQAKTMLSVPHHMINVNSPKLGALVNVLANEATEPRGTIVASTVSAYGNALTLTQKVSANLYNEDNTSGGNTSGGNTSGGNTSGGNTSGGNTSGDNTSGGNTSGGNTSGGNTSGGNTSGGDTSGGNTSGGNTSGGNTSGGNTSGGNTSGDNTSGGNTSGGNTSGGNTSGGNTSGGNTSGGNTSGGNTSGGNTSGGNTSGGNTTGGSTSGGNTSGGSTSGGNTTGGDTTGGNTSGGNTSGDNTSGGNTSGGSTSGGVDTSDSAVDGNYNLYSFVVEKCFGDQTTEGKILTSGALVDPGNITIKYPGKNLLSVSGNKLTAKKFASGISGKDWIPVKYAINGGGENTFSSGTTVTLPNAKDFRVEVTYQLETGVSIEILDLPATLANEAAGQISVLDRLTNPDEPYMGYMEQLTNNQLKQLYDILDPKFSLANMVSLNSNAQKNVALKNAFRSVIAKMRENCYQDDGTLTFYTILQCYIDEGLAHYYRNSSDYLSEVALFSQYLDEILAPEIKDGVYLSAADKESAIEKMVGFAERFGYVNSNVSLDFTDLKNKTNHAKEMLKAPHHMINVDSSKLGVLANVLENEATEPRGTIVGSTVSPYGKALTLIMKVSRDTVNDNTSGGNTPGDDKPGDDNPSDGNTPGGNTPGDDKPGDDNPSGGNTPGGDTPSDGDNSDEDDTDEDGTFYVGAGVNFDKNIASANEGDIFCLTTSVSMKEDFNVHKSITIKGVGYLKTNGHTFILSNVGAAISADSPLNVASGVEGYVPVKSANSNDYRLVEIAAPQVGGKTAGSKAEKLDQTRYLFLDLDPSRGMTLNELRESALFADLSSYALDFSIEGNDGTGLVKTDDRLVVKVSNAANKMIAQITYVIVVMGDTNCNGKVNTSDATVTRSISMGMECSLAVKMAADVNFSGTLSEPKMNSSDVAYIMAKWFAWDLNKYVSNLK